MSVIFSESGIVVPGSIVDLESFSEWVDSPEFPEVGRISFIHGDVVVDSSMEQLFTHNNVKQRITSTLDALVTALGSGYVFSDRARLHNVVAGLSVEPDLMFVSFNAIETGAVTLAEGAIDGFVRVDGSPEIVVEVVSDSSEKQDTVELREAYFQAGILEYWLVDGRTERASFEILRRTAKGFSASRLHSGGWVKSAVFNKSFRLVQAADRLGNPQFTLESRD